MVGGTGGTNFFTWATITLKVPVVNIGYYLSKDAAVAVRTPDGKLPADTTDFYFTDIPVVFNNQSDAYFPSFIKGQPFTLNRVGDIVLQLSIWLPEKGYTPVYVVYDPANMTIEGHAVPLSSMDDLVATLQPLQEQLSQTVSSLQKNHNTALNALLSASYGDAAATDQKTILDQTSQSIVALRQSNVYVVKISPDCNVPANDASIFGGAIILNAAIAFTAAQPITAMPVLMQTLATGLTEQGMINSMQLDNIKQTITAGTASVPDTITPAVEPDTTPSTKKDNSLLWLLGIGTGIYLLSEMDSNGSAKK